MAGEDFFLKFGSNADQFARDVREDVSQARRQIDLLTKSVRELETVTRRSSAATNLISGLREDLRGLGSRMAQDLGNELRTALQRELSNLNINVGANVDTDVRREGGGARRGGGRASSLDTPEADRLAAQAQKQMGGSVDRLRSNLDRLATAMNEQEAKLRTNFDRMTQEQQRALGQMFRVMSNLNAQVQRFQASDTPGVDTGVEMQRLARLSTDIGNAIQTSLRTGVMQLDRNLQGRIQQVTGETPPGVQRGPASATSRAEARQVDIDPVIVQNMIEASQRQMQAAEELQTGVSKFDQQVDRFAAAISNMRVTMAPGEGTAIAAQQQEAVEQVVQKQQRQAPAPTTTGLTDDDIERRKGMVASQLTQLGKRTAKADGPEQIMAKDLPQLEKMREALGSEEAVRRVVDDYVASGRKTADTMATVDQEFEALRLASRQAKETTESVAQANAATAQSRHEETATAEAVQQAEKDLAQSARAAAQAHDAEARAATQAASETAGTAGEPTPRSTEQVNREVRERTRRSRAIQSLLTGYDLEGSTDVPDEGRPADAHARTAQEERARLRAEGMPTFDREAYLASAAEQILPKNIGEEARERLRGVFLNAGDEAVGEARQYLRRVSSEGIPKVSQGAIQAAFSEFGTGVEGMGYQDPALVQDEGLRRQRRRSRALQMLPVLEQGPGSIEAATRGGPLATLNERLRAVGFQGEDVTSRAQGAEVLNQLRTDLDNIVRGMGPTDRESMRQLSELPEEERRVAADRMRAAADEQLQAARMIQAAIRTGAIQPPTGTGTHPDILERVEGEGAGRAGDLRRRAIAERADIVRMAETSQAVEASGIAGRLMSGGATLEEAEAMQAPTAERGQVRRMALDVLEANDQAMVDRYTDIIPENEDIQRTLAQAQQRQAERTARDVEDRRILERKLETSAARGEGAAARTEAVRRGGLQSLARQVEVPEEALRMGAERGTRRLSRLSVGAEDRLTDVLGRGDLAGTLRNFFNQTVDEATELQRQSLLRGEAESALTSAQSFREAGLGEHVDEREVAAAQRIMDRTEGIDRELQGTLRQLFVPGEAAGVEQQRAALREAETAGDPAQIARAQQGLREALDFEQVLSGKSLADFVHGATREGIASAEDTELDPRTQRVMEARMAAQARALESGVEDVTEVMRRAGNIAGRQFDEEQARAESTRARYERFAPAREEAAAAASRHLRPPDVEAAQEALGRRYRVGGRLQTVEEVERRARPFVGRQDDFRAVARGVGTPEQMQSLVQAMGGMEQMVQRIAQARGARGSAEVRTDEEMAARLKPGLREAPEKLAAARQRLDERRTEIAQQQVRVEEANLAAERAEGEEARRHARVRAEAEQRRLRNLESTAVHDQKQVRQAERLVQTRDETLQASRQNAERTREMQAHARRQLRDVVSGKTGRRLASQEFRVQAAEEEYRQRVREVEDPKVRGEARTRAREGLERAHDVRQSERARLTALQQSVGSVQAMLRQTAGGEAGTRAAQSLAEMRGAFRQILQAANAPTTIADEVSNVEQLMSRIQQLAGSVEENTQATRGNTAAERQSTTMQRGTASVASLYERVQGAPTGSGVQANWLQASMHEPSQEVVEGYRQQIRSGAEIEPLTLDAEGQIQDGFHRLRAAMLEGVEEVPTRQEAARRARPTFDLPTGDEDLLRTRGWLAGTEKTAPGFSRSMENLFSRAREYEGRAPGDVGQDLSTVRNMLSRLAGRGFEQYGAEAQRTTTGDARIDDRLIVGAQEGVKQTLAAIQQRGDIGDVEKRVAEQNYPAQIISTLTNLDATMSELIICCKAMQRMAGRGGMGGGVSEGGEQLATQRAGGERVARMITGDLNRRVVEAIGRSEVARGAGDTAGARRALGEAAMEVAADPNIGPALKPQQITDAVQSLSDTLNRAAQAQGTDPYRLSKEDVSSMRADINASRMLGGDYGEKAMRAFRSGDVTATGEEMVRAKGNVQGAMSELVNIFSLDAEAAQKLRTHLEGLQQQLQESGQSAQQLAAAEQSRQQAEQSRETDYQRMVREDYGRALSPEAFDPSAPRAENIQAVAGDIAQRHPDMRLNQVVGNIEQAFGSLDDATKRLVAEKVQEAQASERARRADEAEAAASQRAAAIGELLPTDERRRFQQSIGAGTRGVQPTITPQEVTSRVERTTGGQVRPSATVHRGIQSLFETGQIESRATAHVDRYVESARASIQQYHTPMQQFLGELWSGKGFASSVARTMGNFVSRYVGGAIIFGLAAQFRELTTQALEAEQTMIRITGALDATGRASEGVRSSLQDIAVETNTNISDTYEVMAQLAGVFETTEEALEATRVIGQLELISQGALSAREGFRALSAVVNTFNETLMEERGLSQVGAITYVADLATRIQDLTGVNIEDTTEGLARLGETASTLGIEMELIAAAVGQTAKASGQTGQAASEQIGRILANFQKTGTQDVLVNMGITDQATVDASNFDQVLRDLLGSYNDLTKGQQRKVANLIGDPRQFALTNALLSSGTETLKTYEQSLNNAGAAADRQAKILNTLRGQMGQLGKQVQVLVKSLIDLGLLNVFGALVEAAGLLLRPLNAILDMLNWMKELSPFTSMLVDLGMMIAGFKVLGTLLTGALSHMTRMAGLGEVTNMREAFAAGGQMLRPRRAEVPVPDVDVDPYDIDPLSPGAEEARSRPMEPAPRRRSRASTIAFGPEQSRRRRAGRWVGQTKTWGKLSDRATKASNGLRNFTGGLSKFASTMTMAGLGLSLLIGAIQRSNQELYDFAEALRQQRGERKEDEKEAGETEDETTQRKIGERLDEARNGNWIETMSAGSRHIFGRFGSRIGDDPLRAVGGFVGDVGTALQGWLPGQSRNEQGISDALAGTLPEQAQAQLDASFQEMVAIRNSDKSDAQKLEELAELRERMGEEYEGTIDDLHTAQQKLNYEEQLSGQEGLEQKIRDGIIAAQSGIESAMDFSVAEIGEMLNFYQQIASMDSRSLAQYGDALSSLMGSSQSMLPNEAQAALEQIGSAGTHGQRLGAQDKALDIAYEQAVLELEQAEDEGAPDRIEKATEKLNTVLGLRAQLDKEIMDAALTLPQQYADLYLSTGDYEAAENALQEVINEAQQRANEELPGSPEHVAALETMRDAMRKQAEASIAEDVGTLELASIGLRDPIQSLGNDLEIAQLKLQTAIDNPGAYKPEEIRQFMQEVAQLQEQVGDQQQAIADAMTALAVEQARNPVEKANLEYSAALDAYNRAIDQDMGAEEIISRAQEVEATARAVREREEELRAATAEAEIAGLPQGDQARVMMAELAEAYKRQANVIREFGRDSAEFQDTITEILDARRSVEQAIDEVFSATTDLAVSLAQAAGMDIEASRLESDAAVANLRRAVDEAGGNMEAASVRQAMAEAATAQANLRDTVLGEALDTINFMEEMGDITSNQAIASLNAILQTMDLTEDQRRDIRRQIKGLQDSINEALSGGFNIADVRIPTPYEVRRSLGVDGITEGVEEGRKALEDAFQSANGAASGAADGILDQVLGADLASEVRTVGKGVDDLLPPISEIPRIIDETIASRDAVVAELKGNLEAMVSVRNAQNSSISALGAVITPPANVIADATTQSKDLLALAEESLNAGNTHLATLSEKTSGVIGAINSLPTNISETLMGLLQAERDRYTKELYERHMPDPEEGFMGMRGPAPGRAFGGPVSARQAYTVGEDGMELFVPNTSGYIVKASDFAPMHTNQMGGGGSVINNNYEVSVTVQAETNADANEIARTVERRVSSNLRRSMGANQTTPHMVRMR